MMRKYKGDEDDYDDACPGIFWYLDYRFLRHLPGARDTDAWLTVKSQHLSRCFGLWAPELAVLT